MTRRRTLGAVVAALITAFLLLGVAPARAAASLPTGPPSASTSAQPRRTLLIGMSGLTWHDVTKSGTPRLYRLAERASIASLTARSVRRSSCPIDGWLAISAGKRAAAPAGAGCDQPPAPKGGSVPNWRSYLSEAATDNFNAEPGSLGSALAARPGAAIGPGAAIALADPSGDVADYSRVPRRPRALASLVDAKFADHRLVVVDLGNVAGAGPHRLKELDTMVGAALDGAGRNAAVLTASIADGGGTPRMQFAALRRPGERPGLLTSDSTRQPGLVQSVDIGPTIESDVGRRVPSTDAGAPVERTANSPESAADRIASMHDRDRAVRAQLSISAWFFPALIALMLAAGASAALVRRIRPRAALTGARVGGIALAAVPVSTFLVNVVPWESVAHAVAAMLACLVGMTAAVTAVAFAGPWRRRLLGPLTVVSGITVATLAADVLTGSGLQMSTLLGEPLLTASRFYGIGNSAYALFATTLVLCVVTAMQIRRLGRGGRATLVVVTGVLAGLLLGLPGLGTKFGSVPTIVVGFGLLFLVAVGLRLTWRRGLYLLLGAAALMAALLYLDWLRPPDQRTHFGRFFATILAGDAWPVIWRKIEMNLGILTQSWMTLLLPLFVAAVVLVVLNPARAGVPALAGVYDRTPFLRAGLGSLFALLILGAFVNDSGIIVPAVGILFLAPALTHVGASYSLTSGDNAEQPRARQTDGA
ncbi:hypothetical protein [Spelaeicoccus albus]|uniref:Energy-converting hydrogenase Eha subunit A n=1 Tax=Spelaeicoccus albus TaxID=1280376 RepID=A0A7Z0A7E8_9MICO|nr:hypothetical protein [Spelaeicoccus albus]NYI65812.1 energy-converting hydrogenase Eha subunit A [Spelaeicoccus albus]